MKCEIKSILLDPEHRKEHIKHLLNIDGLEDIIENPNACYCAVPLTGVTENQRQKLSIDHEIIKQCIRDAGISVWDPKDAPGNPWFGLKHTPNELYDVDTIQVVTPKFFEFTNIAPSTGAGIEEQKAIMYNKLAVVITKSGVFTSRMSTGARRIILLEYHDIEKQKEDIKNVFLTLKDLEPGVGNCSVHGNTLLGFKNGEKPVCLKGLIEEKFPQLVYNFDKYIK